jgi:hypothetical protein
MARRVRFCAIGGHWLTASFQTFRASYFRSTMSGLEVIQTFEALFQSGRGEPRLVGPKLMTMA